MEPGRGWTQEMANTFQDCGCSIVLLNSPPGLNVGIDYCMWKTGPKFMGMKLVPPGPHFVYWSIESSGNGSGEIEGDGGMIQNNQFRTGWFVFLEPRQVRDVQSGFVKWN